MIIDLCRKYKLQYISELEFLQKCFQCKKDLTKTHNIFYNRYNNYLCYNCNIQIDLFGERDTGNCIFTVWFDKGYQINMIMDKSGSVVYDGDYIYGNVIWSDFTAPEKTGLVECKKTFNRYKKLGILL